MLQRFCFRETASIVAEKTACLDSLKVSSPRFIQLQHFAATASASLKTDEEGAFSTALDNAAAQESIHNIISRYSHLRLQDIESILKSKGFDIQYSQIVSLLSGDGVGEGDGKIVFDCSNNARQRGSAAVTGYSKKIPLRLKVSEFVWV